MHFWFLWVLYLSKIDLGRVYRTLILFAIFCGTVSLILTRSRGGMLAFCCSIVVMTLLTKANSSINVRISGKRMLILLLALLFLTLRFSHILGQRIFQPTETEVASAHIRIPLMKVGYNVIKTQPLLGVGIGKYLDARVAAFTISFDQRLSLNNIYPTI